MIDLLLQDIKEGVLMQNRAIKMLQEDLEPDAC